ncbi:MAG: DUF4304 domain-containing protein [Planctomycetales bacterium]|nr:DUF4304 domain-containing protein [Planctomycetales bacterium]MCA9225538.1 DUF4304 domain-containing protein [Planctomycetales bacterium]
MNRAAFTKAISKRLYPILRSEGFRGSGNTLRRVNGPVIHVFNVQGSSGGASCYLNLGAHLTFLRTPGGREPDSQQLKEYECVFRDRFEPPAGSGVGWSYGDNDEELNETISFICDHWPIYGHDFFNQFAEYPRQFEALVEDVDETVAHPIQLATLSQIASQLGKQTRAEALALEALSRCPEQATELRDKLNRLIRELGRGPR